jgi:hypothetical protein
MRDSFPSTTSTNAGLGSKRDNDPQTATLGFFLIKNSKLRVVFSAKYAVTTAAQEACGLFLPRLDLATGRGGERPYV